MKTVKLKTTMSFFVNYWGDNIPADEGVEYPMVGFFLLEDGEFASDYWDNPLESRMHNISIDFPIKGAQSRGIHGLFWRGSIFVRRSELVAYGLCKKLEVEVEVSDAFYDRQNREKAADAWARCMMMCR